MIDAQTYLDHIRRDGERIVDAANGRLETDVPSCPGLTSGGLLVHAAGLYLFWSAAIVQNRQPEVDWTVMSTDVVVANREGLSRFVDALATRSPDEPTWTWQEYSPGAPAGTMRFWFRRAAQELAVHRWDMENAFGDAQRIDPTLAADGIDEILTVFGLATGHPDFPGASERFAGDGETFRLEPTDGPAAITFTARPDRFVLDSEAQPNVTAKGTASDLLLFLWGRIPPERLEVSGDATLLTRWQELVKI